MEVEIFSSDIVALEMLYSVMEAVVMETALAAVKSVVLILLVMGSLSEGLGLLREASRIEKRFPVAEPQPGLKNEDASEVEDNDDEEEDKDAGDQADDGGEEEGKEDEEQGPEDEVVANGDIGADEEDEEEDDDDEDDDDDDEGEDEEDEDEEEEEEIHQPPTKKRK